MKALRSHMEAVQGSFRLFLQAFECFFRPFKPFEGPWKLSGSFKGSCGGADSLECEVKMLVDHSIGEVYGPSVMGEVQPHGQAGAAGGNWSCPRRLVTMKNTKSYYDLNYIFINKN